MIDPILVGGNHLAAVLVRRLGPDFATMYPADAEPMEMLERLGASDAFDVWCCWAAIMRASRVDMPSRVPWVEMLDLATGTVHRLRGVPSQ